MSYFKRTIACFMILCMVILFAGCKNTAEEESADLDEFVADQEQMENETLEVPEKEEQSDTTEKPDASETKPQEKPSDEEKPTEEQTPSEQQPEEEAPKEDEPSEEQEPVVEEEETKPAFSMENALKVASFNIKSCYNGETMDQVVALLKKVDADLVGLQEVDCNAPRSGNIHQAQEIAKRAGYPYFCYTPARILGENDPINTGESNVIGHAILSKYPILKSEVIWPKALGDRPRNFSRHEIDINGKTVAFYNCHLDFNVGRYQYEEIQDNYMMKDRYAICIGDFNETMDEMFLQFDYENFHSLAFGDEMENPYLNEKGNQVIDHIVVSKHTMSWYDEEVQNGYYVVPHNGASDHNLVYGYFNLLD